MKTKHKNETVHAAIKKCLDCGAAYTNALNGQYARTGIKATDTIARFLSLENFLKMVCDRSNVLARVMTWRDVYEGFVLRLSYSDCDVAALLGDFYGQCWTRRKSDSEVLWSARCPNGYGVCLKSTIDKLANSVVAQCCSADAIAGCGRLDAVAYEKIPTDYSCRKPNAKKVRTVLSNHATLLDSFFVKRYEFNDENEVRVIIDLPSKISQNVMRRSYKDNLLSYNLARPEDFVDEVIFHPTMRQELCECLKCHLGKNGWSKVKIRRSHLYDLPKGTLKLFE